MSMKKIFAIFVFLICFAAIQAQNETESVVFDNDSTYVDTLNKNLIGLNVYPAFGILGGGRLPNTKIFVQYKHYFDHTNLRTSLNYISFYRNNDNVDIIRTTRDTIVIEGAPVIADSMVFRKFYYDIYSYDARLGLEAAFPNRNFRFYVGGAIIGGYHYTGEYYYHYKREFTGYPIQYVNLTYPANAETVGYRKTRFIKAGMDFTIGVDINISPNCVISVQYAPELVYYHKIKQELLDPDLFYTRDLESEFTFVPDYIDFVVNIRF